MRGSHDFLVGKDSPAKEGVFHMMQKKKASTEAAGKSG